MYPRRVTGVTVQEPAAGNWEVHCQKPQNSPFAALNSAELKLTNKKANR